MIKGIEEIEKFKELILDMHRGIPRFIYYSRMIEEKIPEPLLSKP
jgi:hypothetical protein